MKRRMWIRGDALITVLELDALQAGDEVMVTPDDESFADEVRSKWRGAPRRTTLVQDDSGLKVYCPCRKGGCGNVIPVFYFKVVAWRRP